LVRNRIIVRLEEKLLCTITVITEMSPRFAEDLIQGTTLQGRVKEEDREPPGCSCGHYPNVDGISTGEGSYTSAQNIATRGEDWFMMQRKIVSKIVWNRTEILRVVIAILEFRNFGGFVISEIADFFHEKIPEILENVNAINPMMSINGGLHLLQL